MVAMTLIWKNKQTSKKLSLVKSLYTNDFDFSTDISRKVKISQKIKTRNC